MGAQTPLCRAAPAAHRAHHAGPPRRRRRICLTILLLVLAHQALALRDHRDAGDAVFAASPAPTAAAPNAADGPTGFPDMVGDLPASDTPALLRGACPAHQGTVPMPLSGDDPVLAAAYIDASAAAPWPVGAPRARDGDQRRRRALLQVFRN